MTKIFDVKAASVTGAVNIGKARVIWKDGVLSGYNRDGLAFSAASAMPVRKSGHIRTWVTGNIEISEQCWTCGGWWRMAIKSISELESM